MIVIPDYVKENMDKLLVGLVTVVIVLVPATIYIYRHLPTSTAAPKKEQTKVVQKVVNTPKAYTNPTYKYSVVPPTDSKTVQARSHEFYTDELFYESDLAATSSAKTISIRVFESMGPEWESTKAYFDTLLNEPMGENAFESGRIVKLANVKVANQPAVMQIEQGIGLDGIPYFTKNVYVYANNKLYALMNSGDTQQEVENRDTIFNDIVASIQFLK